MFEFRDTKVFKDTVHGYIQIPKIFVKEIIDTPLFQRLRHVEQTGMRSVYPSARHDRFIHSLGVYHLGEKAVDSLLSNFSKDLYWNVRSDDTRYIFWAKNKVLFLLACLLHDIGHAPFSHSLEKFYIIDTQNASYKKIIYLLKENFPDDYDEFIRKPAPHELVSALTVIEKFKDPIRNILIYFRENKFPDPIIQSLSEHETQFPTIDEYELDEDLRFIARMITGRKYSNFEPEYQIRNCFISLLSGNNFDIDKLDYIIRDSKMSGIDNVELDVERLLKSLTIIKKTNYHDYIFDGESKHSKFENAFILSSSMSKEDGEIYLTGSINGEFRLSTAKVTFYKDSYICLKSKILSVLSDTEVTQDSYAQIGTTIAQISDNGVKRLSCCADMNVDLKITLKNDLKFKCKDTVEVNEAFGEVEISCSNIIMSSTEFSGTIKGEMNLEVLGDTLAPNLIKPSKNAYNSFELGFNKQALNIIQNVIVARNYLYLWIYAHHKVVYTANFLLIELLRLSINILNTDSSISDYISFDSIEDTFDEDIIAIFKQAKKKYDYTVDLDPSKYDSNFLKLYNEYLTRRLKKSLYKSLPEYDMLFKDFSVDKKILLRQKLSENTEAPVFIKDVNGISRIADSKYGFWDPKKNSKMFSDLELEALMWVDASYSMKIQDIKNVYICFPEGKEDKIVNLMKLSILKKEDSDSHLDHYFYIYYELKKDAQININILKQKLLQYFEALLKS